MHHTVILHPLKQYVFIFISNNLLIFSFRTLCPDSVFNVWLQKTFPPPREERSGGITMYYTDGIHNNCI